MSLSQTASGQEPIAHTPLSLWTHLPGSNWRRKLLPLGHGMRPVWPSERFKVACSFQACSFQAHQEPWQDMHGLACASINIKPKILCRRKLCWLYYFDSKSRSIGNSLSLNVRVHVVLFRCLVCCPALCHQWHLLSMTSFWWSGMCHTSSAPSNLLLQQDWVCSEWDCGFPRDFSHETSLNWGSVF